MLLLQSSVASFGLRVFGYFSRVLLRATCYGLLAIGCVVYRYALSFKISQGSTLLS